MTMHHTGQAVWSHFIYLFIYCKLSAASPDLPSARGRVNIELVQTLLDGLQDVYNEKVFLGVMPLLHWTISIVIHAH